MSKSIEVYHPGIDENCLLVVNPNDEGLVIDMYDLEGVLPIATWAVTYQEVAESLLGISPLELVDPLNKR